MAVSAPSRRDRCAADRRVQPRRTRTRCAFARACGFSARLAHDTTSAVDPRTLGSPPEPPDGIAIVPMASVSATTRAGLRRRSRKARSTSRARRDFSGMTYENWRRLIWDSPDCDHELSVVALADGVVVGTSFLYSDRETGRAANAGTGVIRAFRGRGLGLLMKQHSLARAAAAGITTVITQNDDTNAPMLAINAKLGYAPLSSGARLGARALSRYRERGAMSEPPRLPTSSRLKAILRLKAHLSGATCEPAEVEKARFRGPSQSMLRADYRVSGCPRARSSSWPRSSRCSFRAARLARRQGGSGVPPRCGPRRFRRPLARSC